MIVNLNRIVHCQVALIIGQIMMVPVCYLARIYVPRFNIWIITYIIYAIPLRIDVVHVRLKQVLFVDSGCWEVLLGLSLGHH